MTRRSSSSSLSIASVVAGVLAAGAAGAADTADAGVAASTGTSQARADFEEIVVVASRREQEIFLVPQSIQAFTGADLEARGIDSPDTAMAEVPGASVGFKSSPGTAQYNLRGTGGQGQLGDMAIGFYIDDVPYYTPDNPYAPAIRFFDLQDVEVLRGPQGTLYGQGSMGGTIIVRTENPDLDEMEGRVRVRGSSLDGGETGYGVDGTVSVPIAEGKAALRITGGYEKTPGLAESPDFPGEKDIDDGEIWDVRTKLLVAVNDDLSILATYWDSNNEGNFTPTYFSNDPPTLVTGGVRGHTDNRTRLASVVVDWDTAIGTLKSSTSYTDYRDVLLFGVGVTLPGPAAAAFKVDLDARSESFNQEFTLTSHPGPLEWIAGVTYTNADRTTDFAQALDLIDPPMTLFSVDTTTRTDTEQVAVFGEVSRSFMDGKVKPLVGLRYYRDDREFRDNDNHFSETFSTFSPRFNLSIMPSRDSMVYFNVAKGFRSGNFNPQGFVDLAQLFGVDTQAANPEAELWAYEIGSRLRFLDGRLIVQPAVYYNDYRDYQFAGIVGGVTLVSLSLDKVVSKGIDLSITWSPPIEGLTFGVAGNYNETQARDLDDATASQVAGLARNQQLPYTPEWNYSAYANLARPIGNGLDGFLNLSIVGAGEQIGSSGFSSPSTKDISLKLGLGRDAWSVALFANNLANEHRPTAIRDVTTQTRRDPRAIGGEVILRF